MKVERINHIVSGSDYHYLLINHYSVIDSRQEINSSGFILDFLKSSWFKTEYYSDQRIKNPDGYLPFPFNPMNLTAADFKSAQNFSSKFLIKRFDDSQAKFYSDDSFDQYRNGFLSNLQKLTEYTQQFELAINWYFLDIDDFPHSSEKVTPLYNDMGYTVDYFVFGALFLKHGNEFITFEYAYE